MGDRVSRLERTQSVPPNTPKGKGKGKAPPRNSGEEDGADRRLHNDHRAQWDGLEALPCLQLHRDTGLTETMRWWTMIRWSFGDNEDEEPVEAKGLKPFKVAEKIEKFLSNAFSSVVPNTTRCQWGDKYGAPQKCIHAVLGLSQAALVKSIIKKCMYVCACACVDILYYSWGNNLVSWTGVKQDNYSQDFCTRWPSSHSCIRQSHCSPHNAWGGECSSRYPVPPVPYCVKWYK